VAGKKEAAETLLDAFKAGSKGEKQFVDTVKEARKAGGGSGSGGAKAYGTPNDADWGKVLDGSAFGSKGGMDQLSKFGNAINGNWQRDAMEEGRTVLGMAGSHAIRGAAWGAVGGGTIEAAQGGSFWDGAKQGAFNGAVGWTGYRMGMRGVGATSLNPMSKSGVFKQGSTMARAFSKDKEVSGQAVAILNNRQVTGVAQGVMNQRKSAAARKGQ
jgi:hypothetical protein